MRKFTFFLLLSFMVKSTMFAQNKDAELDADFIWCENYVTSNVYYFGPNFIGSNSNAIYAYRAKDGKLYFESYDKQTFKLETLVPLDYEYEGQNLGFKGAFMFNNTPMLNRQIHNKTTGMSYWYAQPLDKLTLNPMKPILLREQYAPQTKKLKRVKSADPISGMSMISENQKLFNLVTFTHPANTENEPIRPIDRIGCKLLDENFDVLIEKEYDFPLNNIRIVDHKLTNDGLIYLIGNEIKLKKSGSSEYANAPLIESKELKIIVIDLYTDELKLIDVPLGDRENKGFKFKVAPDGSIVVCGLIGNLSPTREANGLFFVKYDASYKEEFFNVIDFDKSESIKEKKENMGIDENEAITLSLFDNSVNDIILKPDGTSTFLVEHSIMEMGKTDEVIPKKITLYKSQLIAINFDAFGEIMWTELVNKEPVSQEPYSFRLSSFYTIVRGNYINILFDDRDWNKGGIIKRVLLKAGGSEPSQDWYSYPCSLHYPSAFRCVQFEKNLAYIFVNSTSKSLFGLMEL